MKQKNLKAFTLVEMLIVIVIIGILIAALLPRLQGAQAMARDTHRQSALSQIGAAVVSYQMQLGKWPNEVSSASGAVKTSALTGLTAVGIINNIPMDRQLSNQVDGLGANVITGGDFAFAVYAKNNIPNGGFVVMARTETPGNSNWVVCGTGGLSSGDLITGTDLKDVFPCESIERDASACQASPSANKKCKYSSESQLRYIYLY